MPELEVLFVDDAASWWRFLESEHATSPGVRLAIPKKGAGGSGASYDEALDAALCWGWIDGTLGRLDERHYLQRFTRRGPRSVWSARNVGIVGRLVEEGRMRPPGSAAVDAAKADGRWDAAYAGAADMAVPPDFAAALAASPVADAAFAAVDRTNRYAFLWRIHQAKRPETRAGRIVDFVGMLERGETPHPPVRQRRSAPGS